MIQALRTPSFGFAARLFAVVALAVQLAATSVVPWGAMQGAGIDRLLTASICHGDAAGADQGGAPAHHHTPACAACPLCQAIAQAGLLLGPAGFVFAAPVAALLRITHLPPARAPPARRVAATSARGPPALI